MEPEREKPKTGKGKRIRRLREISWIMCKNLKSTANNVQKFEKIPSKK